VSDQGQVRISQQNVGANDLVQQSLSPLEPLVLRLLKKRYAVMTHLPRTATDEELISFVDQWAALMQFEEYEQAYTFTGHFLEMGWSAFLAADSRG